MGARAWRVTSSRTARRGALEVGIAEVAEARRRVARERIVEGCMVAV